MFRAVLPPRPAMLSMLVIGMAPGAIAPALAQSPTPADHPGFVLAEAIAARGCVLHQDDVGALLEDLGLASPDFPAMALPLLQDGIMAPTGNGTLTLVNWGLCTGLPGPGEAEAEAEAGAGAPAAP